MFSLSKPFVDGRRKVIGEFYLSGSLRGVSLCVRVRVRVRVRVPVRVRWRKDAVLREAVY